VWFNGTPSYWPSCNNTPIVVILFVRREMLQASNMAPGCMDRIIGEYVTHIVQMRGLRVCLAHNRIERSFTTTCSLNMALGTVVIHQIDFTFGAVRHVALTEFMPIARWRCYCCSLIIAHLYRVSLWVDGLFRTVRILMLLKNSKLEIAFYQLRAPSTVLPAYIVQFSCNKCANS